MLNKAYNRPEFIDDRKKVSFLNREIRLKEILRYKNSGQLLDVGCALGFFLKFAEKKFETYGFDISPYAIKKAKKIATKSRLFAQDAQKRYPFDNNFFDIITCYDLIEHLQKPERCIKEIFRVLKPNGYLFLQTPTDKSQKIMPDETHINLFSRSKIIFLLRAIGFKKIIFRKRRSILYINKIIKKLFFRKNSHSILDSYSSTTTMNSLILFIIKKIKLLVYQFDKFISKFTPAPEMFIIAQK